MRTQRTDVSRFPLFTNMRARCVQCGSGPPIWVIFCRGCREVDDAGGEHFHRRCERCGNRWIEQATEESKSHARSEFVM